LDKNKIFLIFKSVNGKLTGYLWSDVLALRLKNDPTIWCLSSCS